MTGARAALVAAVVALGCKGKAAPVERAPALSTAERALATDACGDYVRRLCACAETKPDLAATCRLKQAKPEAVALTLGVIDDPGSSADSVARAKAELGKIVGKCIEEAAQLPALGCP
jgi:hypothetical protein